MILRLIAGFDHPSSGKFILMESKSMISQPINGKSIPNLSRLRPFPSYECGRKRCLWITN